MKSGISSHATMAGSIGAVGALEAEMAATAAVTGAAGSAVVPSGSESASALASANTVTSAQDFTAKLQDATAQMRGLNEVLAKRQGMFMAEDAVHTAQAATVNAHI